MSFDVQYTKSLVYRTVCRRISSIYRTWKYLLILTFFNIFLIHAVRVPLIVKNHGWGSHMHSSHSIDRNPSYLASDTSPLVVNVLQ
jgi:hypothetical protein